MKRKGRSAGGMWLIVAGVCASVTVGLAAANYTVGGIDPFYRSPPTPAWARSPGRAVTPPADDPMVSSAIPAVAETAPFGDLESRLAAQVPDYDWEAEEARAQRELDHALASIDGPPVKVRETEDYGPPPLAPPAQPPAQLPAQPSMVTPGAPVTADGSLIY